MKIVEFMQWFHKKRPLPVDLKDVSIVCLRNCFQHAPQHFVADVATENRDQCTPEPHQQDHTEQRSTEQKKPGSLSSYTVSKIQQTKNKSPVQENTCALFVDHFSTVLAVRSSYSACLSLDVCRRLQTSSSASGVVTAENVSVSDLVHSVTISNTI